MFILLSFIFSLTCLVPSPPPPLPPPPPPSPSLSLLLLCTRQIILPFFFIHIAQPCTSLSTPKAYLLSSGILRIGQQDSAWRTVRYSMVHRYKKPVRSKITRGKNRYGLPYRYPALALRPNMWPELIPLRDKLYGNLEELRRTAAFVRAISISV